MTVAWEMKSNYQCWDITQGLCFPPCVLHLLSPYSMLLLSKPFTLFSQPVYKYLFSTYYVPSTNL